MSHRYSKAGEPTTLAVATAIESLRDALFREFGTEYAFSVLGRGAPLGAALPDTTIHAVIRESP